MRKLVVLFAVMALVAIGTVAFAADVYNDKNDTMVADRIISAIPTEGTSTTVYACHNGNGWCGVNQSLATPENMAASVMTKEADGFWRAKGLAGDRFHPGRLKVASAADVKSAKDIAWAKLEKIVPISNTPWVDMSEGSPCILAKK